MNKQQWKWISLGVLFLVAVAIRVPYTRSIEGVVGGDAFNYLSKSQALVQGEDPFTADPRKGPVFSFLIAPGLATADPLLWARWVGIVAAASTAVLTTLIASRLGITWPLALLGGLLVAVNKEFIWESPNALANTTFVAFIMASVLAYLQSKKSTRALWILSVLVALTTLTRYEGMLVAAVLLPAAWWSYRNQYKIIAKSIAITAVLMAIPLVSFVWSGTSGVRTPGDIAGDEGLLLASSAKALRQNWARTVTFFDESWVSSVRSGKETAIHATAQWAVLLGSVVGLMWLIYKNRWQSLPVFLAPGLLIVVIALMLPKSRYFIPVIPFIALSLVGSLQLLAGARIASSRFYAIVLAGFIAAGGMYVSASNVLEYRIEKYNADAHETAVLLRAVQYLRNDHGRVGVKDNELSGPISLYIPTNRLYALSIHEGGVLEQELSWLRNQKIKYILTSQEEPEWQSIQTYPEAFERVHVFESIYGESKVFVYKVLPEKLPND